MANSRKLYPTTFGLFWQWYTECGQCLTKEDVTASFLEKYLGRYFNNSPSRIENTMYLFLGLDKSMKERFSSYEDLASFIRCWFDIPIFLYQYQADGTQFIRFNLGNIVFDIECCDDWGTYEFPVNEFGVRID